MAEISEDWRGQTKGDKGRKLEFYERRSEFDRHDGTMTGKFKLALDVTKSAKNILDVGCGDGHFLKNLSATWSLKMACGIDIALRSLQIAKSAGVEVILCDIDNGLPFKNECFDVVLCFDVIEHLFDPDYLLREAYRVLAWGGDIVITTPNLASWYNRICLFVGWQPFWSEVSTRFVIGNPIRKRRMMKEDIIPSGHLRVFTTKALKELLERYNFSVEIKKGYPFFNRKFLGLLDSTFSRGANLASFVMIKAKKIRK